MFGGLKEQRDADQSFFTPPRPLNANDVDSYVEDLFTSCVSGFRSTKTARAKSRWATPCEPEYMLFAQNSSPHACWSCMGVLRWGSLSAHTQNARHSQAKIVATVDNVEAQALENECLRQSETALRQIVRRFAGVFLFSNRFLSHFTKCIS